MKRISLSQGFNVERWFAPFILKWLDHISEKTTSWVQEAVRVDTLVPTSDEIPYSSSVTDLFTVVYAELEGIKNLKWNNVMQRASFINKFAKVKKITLFVW